MALSIALMAIGSLVGVIAWVWLLVRAFRTGIGWGLLILLLGWTLIPVVIFAVKHWEAAKRPTVLAVVGAAISVVAAGLGVVFGVDLDSVIDGGPVSERRLETDVSDRVLPPPRPTAQPTHPSWEAVVREMDRDTNAGWETFVPSPTPITGRPRAGALDWGELETRLGHTVIVELENSTVITASLEAVEPDRIRVRHVIGGGEASYWIERGQISLIRTQP